MRCTVWSAMRVAWVCVVSAGCIGRGEPDTSLAPDTAVMAVETSAPSEPETKAPNTGRKTSIPTPTTNEYIIWYHPKSAPGSYESAWIREAAGGSKDGSYEVLATRPEIVVSDSATLWAVRPSERPAAACPGGPATLDRGVFFAPLGPGKASAPVDPDRFFGGDDADGERHISETPTGSFDDYVIVRRVGSSFRCGARDQGVDLAALYLVDWNGERGTVTAASRMDPRYYLEKEPPLAQDMVDPKLDPDCYARVQEREVEIELLGIRKQGERFLVDRRARLRESETSNVCLVQRDEVLEFDASRAGRFVTPGVRSALLARAADGAFGIADLNLFPFDADDEQAAARVAFADPASAVPWPAPEARDEVGAALTQAAVELARHRPAAAIEIYDRLIATSPHLGRAWFGRGDAKRIAGDIVGARADLIASLALDSAPAFRAEVYVALAETARDAGELGSARAHYESASRFDPERASEFDVGELPAVAITMTPDSNGRLDKRFEVIGLPAVSADGNLLLSVFRDGGLGVRIQRIGDGKVVFTKALFTGEDDAREGSLPAMDFLEAMERRLEEVEEKLDEHEWSSLPSLEVVDGAAGTPDSVAVTWRDGVLRVASGRRAVAYERTLRLDPTSGDCAHAGLGNVWADLERNVLRVELGYRGTDTCPAPTAVTKLWRMPDHKQHGGWREVPTPMLTLPDIGDLCMGRTRLAAMLAPIGVVDFASLGDYSEQGNGQYWTRLVTGARAKKLADKAFTADEISDWCSCNVEEETGVLTCTADPFERTPGPEQLGYCERRGYGHGGSLICFARRDARSPWYVSLIGGAEEGNDVQDAQVEFALATWNDLFRRSSVIDSTTEPATADMLGGPEQTCPDGASYKDAESAAEHLRVARRSSDAFAARYNLYLAVHADPTHIEARLALARAFLKDGDARGAYRELLVVRALAPAATVLDGIKRDASFAALTSEPLFASIVDPGSTLVPCKVPDEWRE